MIRRTHLIAVLSIMAIILTACLSPFGRGSGETQTKANESETEKAGCSRWGNIAVSAEKAKTISIGMKFSDVYSLMGLTNRYRSISSLSALSSLSPFADMVYPCHYSYLLDDDGLMVLELKINNYSYEQFVSELGGWKFFSDDRKPKDYFSVSSISVLYGDEATAYMTGGAGTTDVNTSVPDPDDGVSAEDIYFSPHDNCTDISKISAGMTDTEVRSILPIDSYADGLSAGLYVNDRETGHVFNVKWDLSKYPLVVTSITDTGIDVDFIAPVDALGRLEKGMTFNEVVQILGRPLYMPTFGTISMLWRIGDRDTFVHLTFVNGEAMIYDGDEPPKPFSR